MKAGVPFIFVTILLDALGLGLLIPVLPDVLRRFSSDPTFVSERFGWFIGLYAFMQFVASPVLGSLSDRYGRRPILLGSHLGVTIPSIQSILGRYTPPERPGELQGSLVALASLASLIAPLVYTRGDWRFSAGPDISSVREPDNSLSSFSSRYRGARPPHWAGPSTSSSSTPTTPPRR